MEFRTSFHIDPSDRKITYHDPVMFIGSCFAASIGEHFEEGHMPVIINPAGTVYNPVSVINTLDAITGGKLYGVEDLYEFRGTWLSFDHYTDFSSDKPEEVIDKINRRSKNASEFLSKARFLFITFGTARIFRFRETGKIVSNCHKIPDTRFINELLPAEVIESMWSDQLDKLKSLFPGLNVVFTISPVRHWKDGAHGNQVSKSVLFVAVEKLLSHQTAPSYFPAYELVMDDLRDYRFYDSDMLHLSSAAVEYIWNAFTDCYFNSDTLKLWSEVSGIAKAVGHTIRSGSRSQIVSFAETMLARVERIGQTHPYLSLEAEKEYFEGLLK